MLFSHADGLLAIFFFFFFVHARNNRCRFVRAMAASPGRLFMLTALLLPLGPGGGSCNPSLRLIPPLTAQVRRKRGEGTEERVEEPESWRG